jgi:hypothetical protein
MQMTPRMSCSTSIPFSLVLLLALSSVLLQAGIRTVADESAIAKGTWGGEHAILEVSENSTEVEFDCAHGHIAQAITLDKHGDFDVAGTFTPEHGGPVMRDENTPSAPARYSGHVVGDTLSLTVTLAKENVGTFTLTRGSRPNLKKCR